MRYWQACGHLGICPHPDFSWDQENISEVNFPFTVLVPADNGQLQGQAGAWLESHQPLHHAAGTDIGFGEQAVSPSSTSPTANVDIA